MTPETNKELPTAEVAWKEKRTNHATWVLTISQVWFHCFNVSAYMSTCLSNLYLLTLLQCFQLQSLQNNQFDLFFFFWYFFESTAQWSKILRLAFRSFQGIKFQPRSWFCSDGSFSDPVTSSANLITWLAKWTFIFWLTSALSLLEVESFKWLLKTYTELLHAKSIVLFK